MAIICQFSAPSQLALLKQLLDCAWRAIANQTAAQKKEQELKLAQAASKPRGKRSAAPARAKPTPAKPSTPTPPNKAQINAQNASSQTPSSALLPNATGGTAYKTAHVPIRPYSGYGLRKAYGATN